ncbi:MAG: polysaccharide deacetylase family protein [Coriobacteriia bacterium]|nr:polysaccharide deacetylase family protein [Coriobacteriia bacterium]
MKRRRLRTSGERVGAAVLAAMLLGAMMLAAGCDGGVPSEPLQPLPDASRERAAPDSDPDGAPVPVPAPLEPTPVEPAPPSTPEPADNTVHGWYYTANQAHAVPGVPADARRLLDAYSGRYTGPDAGLVYLTFDEGYENGYTAAILDTLASSGVKATFFVTESYIRNNPALVRRMADEGHVVGNHTATHPSLPSIAGDRDAFAEELTLTEDAYEDATGRPMARVMRPPMGEYSARSLWLTQQLGYESVFWSFAHRDWLVDDQPPVDVTLGRILDGSHPGAIYLLHAVSFSNTAALEDAIAGLRARGYGFGTL